MSFAGKRVLGLIPARGGSKGLTGKNMFSLNGQPLIWYSIQAGLNSNYIDAVIVSSDDQEILSYSETVGANVLKRPDVLATDSAPIHQAISHAIGKIKEQNLAFDLVALLQPTSPLRTFRHIDLAFKVLTSSDSTSLISVFPFGKSPFKCFTTDDSGFLKGLVDNLSPFRNRQNLPEVYMPNGAIYIFSIDDFLKNNRIPVDKIVPFIMDKKDSIDIDTEEDIKTAENILKQR